MSWIVAKMRWIMLVSGALTCTMTYAAIAPQAALRSTLAEPGTGSHRPPAASGRIASALAPGVETVANFRPGFRISEVDVGLVILGILASVLLGRLDDMLGVATLFTVAHFFLFCNVLRMNRPLELIWSVFFVLLAGGTLLVGMPTWGVTLILMLSVTAVFAVIQVLLPSYHGVFWRKINPNLLRWWESNRAGKL